MQRPEAFYFLFQSTHPAGGETLRGIKPSALNVFQSTHPAGGETLLFAHRLSLPFNFNPLTPRGVRHITNRSHISDTDFNPLTPRGVRHTDWTPPVLPVLFQSTHPAGGETKTDFRFTLPRIFQSTHPAGGETFNVARYLASNTRFQSTHPAGGETALRKSSSLPVRISIHSPRGG